MGVCWLWVVLHIAAHDSAWQCKAQRGKELFAYAQNKIESEKRSEGLRMGSRRCEGLGIYIS